MKPGNGACFTPAITRPSKRAGGAWRRCVSMQGAALVGIDLARREVLLKVGGVGPSGLGLGVILFAGAPG